MAFVSFTKDKCDLDHAAPSHDEQWPFMIGASVLPVDGSLLVFGGGATCFSMGTFWETGIYSAKIPSHLLNASSQNPPLPQRPLCMDYLESPQLTPPGKNVHQPDQSASKATLITIPRVALNGECDFQEILRNRRPVVIEGLNMGACSEKWTPEYMAERLGATKEVSDMNHSATLTSSDRTGDCARMSNGHGQDGFQFEELSVHHRYF